MRTGGREASDSRAEPRVTSSAAGIYSLHGKKGITKSQLTNPLDNLSVSFHTSVDFAEHALRITKVITNISTQTFWNTTFQEFISHMALLSEQSWAYLFPWWG